MPLSTATITGDIADMVGSDFDSRRTKIWVTTNVESDTVIDTDGNAIRLGSGTVTLNSDGTFSAVVWAPGTGSNPDSWQTYVNVSYPDPGTRERRTRAFGPFTVTASANLADLVEEQEIPAEYLTQVTDELQTYSDSAAASAASAATSAGQAQTYRDQAAEIAVGDVDAALAGLIDTPSSDVAAALSASFARRDSVPINVKLYGAVGDGVADDTAAIQSALDVANLGSELGPGTIFLPSGQYLVSEPLTFRSGVSIWDNGPADSGGHHATRIVADDDFVGDAILKMVNPGVDQTWHWASIQNLGVYGNGPAGPDGINPGYMGEAASIRSVTAKNCRHGLHFSGGQFTAHLDTISVFNNAVGLYFENLESTASCYGLSGDDNGNLVYLSGGRSANVNVFGVKAESYAVGAGDPVFNVVDLDGGALNIFGGWIDTDGARDSIVEMSATTAVNRPRISIVGLDGNALYTNLINDLIGGRSVPLAPLGVSRPAVFYNIAVVSDGQGGMLLGEQRSLNAKIITAGTTPILKGDFANRTTLLGMTGGDGGQLVTASEVQCLAWGAGGTNIGFLGATPVTRRTLPAAATDAATTQALANALRQALIDLGLAQ